MYLASIAPMDLCVSELSPAYICASFAFLLKLSQKLLQKTQSCWCCFLPLCCGHVAGEESVIAVEVCLL